MTGNCVKAVYMLGQTSHSLPHLPHALAADSALAELALGAPLAKEGEARGLASETHLQ